MSTTTTQFDPLGLPNVIRIYLEPHQTIPLAGLGEHFIAISRATYPNAPGWCLLALPVSKSTGDAACNVALGTHRAAKIKNQSIV